MQTIIFDKLINKIAILLLTLLTFNKAQSQVSPSDPDYLNTITTAVPFVSIITNSQAGAMGYIGAVASDLYTQNGLDQNPAMLSRGQKIMGAQLSYTQWDLTKKVNINIYDLGYFHSINQNNTLGLSARYFKLEEILLYSFSTGELLKVIEPKEMFVALKYAHNFSDHFSMGTGMKYIYSDLTNRYVFHDSLHTVPGKSVAFDLGFDYRRYFINNEKLKLKWNAGLAILNIGSKISYQEEKQSKDFIPQTLKLGTLFTIRTDIDSSTYIALDVAYQIDKLLVPTPPIYGTDANGNEIIVDGKDPDVSVLKGIVQSFYDAPGGLEEELHEIMHQVGSEFRVVALDNKLLFAFRAGYFSEHESKGNRKVFTYGAGLGYGGFRLDFAYYKYEEPRSFKPFTISLGGRFLLGQDNFFRFSE